MLYQKQHNLTEQRTTNVVYPYLFQTCGFPLIDDIRAEIESQRHWDFAASALEADAIQRRASKKYGIVPPYTQEQDTLVKLLRDKRAGRSIATYAWGLYAHSRIPSRLYA